MKNVSLGAQNCLYWYRKDADGTVHVGSEPPTPVKVTTVLDTHRHRGQGKARGKGLKKCTAARPPKTTTAVSAASLTPNGHSAASERSVVAASERGTTTSSGRQYTHPNQEYVSSTHLAVTQMPQEGAHFNPHRHYEGQRTFNIFRADMSEGRPLPRSDEDIQREFVQRGKRPDTTKGTSDPTMLIPKQQEPEDDLAPRRTILRQCRDMWEWQKEPMRLHDEREAQRQTNIQKAEQARQEEKRRREAKFRWHLKHVANFKRSNRISLRRYPAHAPETTRVRCCKDHAMPLIIGNAAVTAKPIACVGDRLPQTGIVTKPSLVKKTQRPATAKAQRHVPTPPVIAPSAVGRDNAPSRVDSSSQLVAAPPKQARRPQTARRPEPERSHNVSGEGSPPRSSGGQQSRPVSARLKHKIAKMAERFHI